MMIQFLSSQRDIWVASLKELTMIFIFFSVYVFQLKILNFTHKNSLQVTRYISSVYSKLGNVVP